MQLQKASTACRPRGDGGQSTVEFAVVAAAFLAVTLGAWGTVAGRVGRFVRRTCAFNGIAPHRRRGRPKHWRTSCCIEREVRRGGAS